MAAALRPACSASFAKRHLARRLGVAVREARTILPCDDAHLRSVEIALFALGGELRPPPSLTLKDQVNTGPSHVGALASLLAALATPSTATASSSCWDLPAPAATVTAWPRLLCLDLLIPSVAVVGVQTVCRKRPEEDPLYDILKFTEHVDGKLLGENPECDLPKLTDHLDAKRFIENSAAPS